MLPATKNVLKNVNLFSKIIHSFSSEDFFFLLTRLLLFYRKQSSITFELSFASIPNTKCPLKVCLVIRFGWFIRNLSLQLSFKLHFNQLFFFLVLSPQAASLHKLRQFYPEDLTGRAKVFSVEMCVEKRLRGDLGMYSPFCPSRGRFRLKEIGYHLIIA